MRFNCPECQKAVEVEGRFIGKLAACPYCGKEVRVPMIPGDPPPAKVTVAGDDEVPSVSWSSLPWRQSASVSNALRILLVVVAVVIALLLFRIERQLASVPRMSDIYEDKGQLLPHGVTDAEARAPVLHIESDLRVEDGSEVIIGNLAEEPVPVKLWD